MLKFLMILIDCLDTIDGNRGTRTAVTEALLRQNKSSDAEKINHNLMRKTLLKYKIIKLRSKISYISFINSCTITELFLKQIISSYYGLLYTKQIKEENYTEEYYRIVDGFKDSNLKNSFVFLIRFNILSGRVKPTPDLIEKLRIHE